MPTRNHRAAGALISAISVAACHSPPASTRPDAIAATVAFVQVETGCWALETQAGRVQPLNLPEEFRHEGLRVSVVLKDAPDMMSACQVGPLKRIEHIERER